MSCFFTDKFVQQVIRDASMWNLSQLAKLAQEELNLRQTELNTWAAGYAFSQWVITLIKRNDKIGAIKQVREELPKLALIEAKELVESVQRQMVSK